MFPNCSHPSSEPPVCFADRRAWHLLDSTASQRHSRNTPSFSGRLEVAVLPEYLREYLYPGFHLAPWLHLGALQKSHRVCHPMILLTLHRYHLVPFCSLRLHYEVQAPRKPSWENPTRRVRLVTVPLVILLASLKLCNTR